MICIFLKNVFVDFWHNDEANTGNWIERTIAGKGWSPLDVKVVKFYASRADNFSFDENGNCIKYRKVMTPVIENGVETEKETLERDGTYGGKIIYANGTMVNQVFPEGA